MSTSQGLDQDASSGGFFEGVRFWLAHRMPDRANIIALVKKHGGIVEPFDTRADVLIADHARKNPPPNSFSWRLITESDKAGRLVDKEPHRIGPPPTAPRPVASAAPTRSFRTPYTAADDALLASWVSGYEKKSGNKIYQELEATHPQHTWHSWRDRWVKHLRNLPHYVLDQMVMAHASNERGSGTQEKGSQPPTQQQPRAQQPARQSPVTKSPPQPPGPLLRSERETSPDFDDDDDALLEKWVKAKVGSGERWNNISIYQELSNKQSHHSAQSWKRHFATLWREERIDMKSWGSGHEPASQHTTSPSLRRSERRARNRNIPSAQKSESSGRDDMFLQQSSEASPKGTFYQNLDAWIEVEAEGGKKWDVTRWHRIQDRKFELWDLYQAVVEQDCPMDEVDWELVANKLGFDLVALEELEGCWDKNLVRFHENAAGFDYNEFVGSDVDNTATEEDDSGDEDASPSSLNAPTGGADDDFEDESTHRPANPMTGRADEVSHAEDAPTPRRSHPSPSLSDRALPKGSLRKRRLGRNSEIRSTPKAHLRPGSRRRDDNPTPSKRRRLFSNAEEQQRIMADTDEDEDEFYEAPTHQRSVPQEANPSSPLVVRSRSHQGSIIRSSSSSKVHTSRSQSTSRPTSSTHSASKHRALSRAIAREPEPEPHGIGDADESEASEGDNDEEIQATLEKFERQGYTRDMALDALYWTSLVPALAPVVLGSLEKGDGPPDGLRGIWTRRDDDNLRAVDAVDMNHPTENLTEQNQRRRLKSMMEELLRKHGVEIVEARRQFLAHAEETGLHPD